MSDAAPLLFTAPPPRLSWRVTLATNEQRTFEAVGFNVSEGALVLLKTAGCVCAYAPGQWLSIELFPAKE